MSFVDAGTALDRRCQTQVGDLEFEILANKNVRDLDVSVAEAIVMDGFDSLQNLKEELQSM